ELAWPEWAGGAPPTEADSAETQVPPGEAHGAPEAPTGWERGVEEPSSDVGTPGEPGDDGDPRARPSKPTLH
ncbi:hypothetical protein HG543_53515, partial [Pyxidicoccus fallax]|nr:hypothetical protein [Pyxidicoccus fallax]